MDPATMGMILSAGLGAYGAGKQAKAQREQANLESKNQQHTSLVKLLQSLNLGFASQGMQGGGHSGRMY